MARAPHPAPRRLLSALLTSPNAHKHQRPFRSRTHAITSRFCPVLLCSPSHRRHHRQQTPVARSRTSPPAPLQPAVRFRNNTLIVDSSSRQHPAFLTRSSECPPVIPSHAHTHTQSYPSVHISICPRARSHPLRSTSLPQLHRLSHRHAADHPPIRQTSYSFHTF